MSNGYELTQEQKDKIRDLYIESDYNNIQIYVDSIIRHEYFRKGFDRWLLIVKLTTINTFINRKVFKQLDP